MIYWVKDNLLINRFEETVLIQKWPRENYPEARTVDNVFIKDEVYSRILELEGSSLTVDGIYVLKVRVVKPSLINLLPNVGDRFELEEVRDENKKFKKVVGTCRIV